LRGGGGHGQDGAVDSKGERSASEKKEIMDRAAMQQMKEGASRREFEGFVQMRSVEW
jgi:hypothetical protein